MNNKEALRGKLRGKMYANLCWTYVCLGYIGHFSKSALMAECNSHWLLNRWSDCITCWVTVQASGVRVHLLSKMTIDSLSKLQLNLKMGLGTESTDAKRIPSLTLGKESRREAVLKIEHFQIRGSTFFYHSHSGILFHLRVVHFTVCFCTINTILVNCSPGISYFMCLFIHSINIYWGQPMLKALSKIYLNRE